MKRKWICLVTALTLMVAAAGLYAFGEEEPVIPVAPEGETEEMDDVDGDDSEQIPVDIPEGEEEEASGESTEGSGRFEETVIRLLKAGDEGDDVLFLQLRLESLQYFTGTPDGKYGPDTEEAVRQFQADNQASGLTVTGQADEATQILAAATHYRTLRYGSGGDDVKELQTRLTALGYYTGKISGNYLEGSTNGIKLFQKNNDLEVTGIADPRTQEVLYSFEAVAKYDVADPTPTPFDDSSYYLVNEDESGAPMSGVPVYFTKELKSGMTGSDLVKQLQERIKELGYYDGPVSGNYMEKTLKAIKKIQTQNGMKASGVTDEATWNLIFNNPGIVMPGQTPKPTATPEPAAFAITVDVKNQIVSVYTRDEEGNYTVPVRQMLCSTGKVGTDSPVGDWVLNGRKARWCYFPKWGDYARYWTRINKSVAFHSPIYSSVSNKAMKTGSYKMLGQRASHGCIRLSVPDAKWIYDNVGAGTVVTITTSLPKDPELKEALKLPASPNATFTPEPAMPDYSRENPPELKKRNMVQGERSDDVYWVQRRLKELGYYNTMCTGHFLDRTAQAVRDFQKDNGFYQSGTVNQQLIDLMVTAEKPTPTPEPTATPGPTVTPAPQQ